MTGRNGGNGVVWMLASAFCLFASCAAYAQNQAVIETTSTVKTSIELTPAEKKLQEMVSETGILLKQHQYSKAEVNLREILKEYPGNMNSKLMLATILMDRSAYSEAIAILEDILVKHQNDAHLLNNYAWLLATANDYQYRNPERALELARDALFLSPLDYQIWSTLAEAHFINGNFEKAVLAIEKGIELALLNKASEEKLQTYQMQYRKYQEVFVSMSLVE